MYRVPYSYAVLGYRHDAATREVLNIGVLFHVHHPETKRGLWDAAFYPPPVSRLAAAFRGFSTEDYARTIGAFLDSVARANEEGRNYCHGEDFALELWSDQGLSYIINGAGAGIMDWESGSGGVAQIEGSTRAFGLDIQTEIVDLFWRFVPMVEPAEDIQLPVNCSRRNRYRR